MGLYGVHEQYKYNLRGAVCNACKHARISQIVTNLANDVLTFAPNLSEPKPISVRL